MAVTRKEIRRSVLRRLGDLIVLKATANGTMTTFIDARNLVGEPDAYRGRFVRFTGGTPANLGQIRFISGSDRMGRTITLDAALPAVTALDDEAEVANMHGTGYRFQDVDMAIDAAFEAAADFAPEQVAFDAGAFNESTQYVEIPADWVAISGVEYRNEDGAWQRMTYHGRKYGDGWTLDRPSRRVYISGCISNRVNGTDVRLVGQRRPTVPLLDTDTTEVNAEWLIARCVSELSAAAYRRTPTPERERVMGYDLQNEQSIRSRVTKRSAPNTLRLV